MSRVLPAVITLCLLWVQPAQADLHFQNIWGRSGTVDIGGSESSVWRLATTDTDENTRLTLSNGPLGVNGPIAPSGFTSISFEGFGGYFPGVEVADLGGSAITRLPHDLDFGNWAYGMAILEGSGPTVVESYFQIRLAGSSAVVQDLSLAQQAVTQGRWPSVNTYIEFDPGYAYYSANDFDPISPSDYMGYVMPECSSAALLLLGLSAGLLRRLGYR
jgi:hypothetical protein